MPSRHTADPSFGEWVTQTLLLPTAQSGGWASALPTMRTHATLIPNYQRGISWGAEQVSDLLYSSSPVVGTVVLGKFQGAPGWKYLDPKGIGLNQEYEELADGLQRLSAGISLLLSIFKRVLDNGAPQSQYAHFFTNIQSDFAGKRAILDHNHHQMLNHPRQAISEQYRSFSDEVDTWLATQLKPGLVQPFSTAFEQLMSQRPIAVDRWSGFSSGLDLMYTFLGLNTVRVDLSPVDLLRAQLVVEANQAGWSVSDIEDFENEYTDIFTSKGVSDSDLLPLVNALLKCTLGPSPTPTVAFPTWGKLDKAKDIDPFLDFVGRIKGCSDPYLDQIRLIGAIPFGVVIASYLRQYRKSSQLPGFLGSSGATAAEASQLHALVCGSIRSSLAKKLGYQSELIIDCLKGVQPNLLSAADSLSQDAVGRSINTQVDLGWLKVSLESVERSSAKVIFNAMLLPVRRYGSPPLGGSFAPLHFGRRAKQWAVDHLYPESLLSNSRAGYREGKRLRNLAPLPSGKNSSAKHADPSIKLQINASTFYAHANTSHPYCAWLVQQARVRLPQELDAQEELEPNSKTALGDDRVQHIANELLQRI